MHLMKQVEDIFEAVCSVVQETKLSQRTGLDKRTVLLEILRCYVIDSVYKTVVNISGY